MIPFVMVVTSASEWSRPWPSSYEMLSCDYILVGRPLDSVYAVTVLSKGIRGNVLLVNALLILDLLALVRCYREFQPTSLS